MALQVAIPASYYFVRNDRDDERFAWRMFSTVRLTRCEVSAFDVSARERSRVELTHALHASWIRSLERGRARVIDRYLTTRCQLAGVTEAVVERRCQTPAGEHLPLVEYHHACPAQRL